MSLASLKDRARKPSLQTPSFITEEFRKRHSLVSQMSLEAQLALLQSNRTPIRLSLIPESPHTSSESDTCTPSSDPTTTSRPSAFPSITQSVRSAHSSLSLARPGESSYLSSYLPCNYNLGVQIVNDNDAMSSSSFRLLIELSVLDSSRKIANCAWKLLTERSFRLRVDPPVCLSLTQCLRDNPEIDNNKHEMAFRLTIDKVKKQDRFTRKLQHCVPLSQLITDACNTVSLSFHQKRFGNVKTIRVDVSLRFSAEKHI